MKALNLLCAAEDKHYVKVTGKAHDWDVLFYIFQSIRVVLLFTMIGTGWSFLKLFLQAKEKNILVIGLQYLLGKHHGFSYYVFLHMLMACIFRNSCLLLLAMTCDSLLLLFVILA